MFGYFLRATPVTDVQISGSLIHFSSTKKQIKVNKTIKNDKSYQIYNCVIVIAIVKTVEMPNLIQNALTTKNSNSLCQI